MEEGVKRSQGYMEGWGGEKRGIRVEKRGGCRGWARKEKIMEIGDSATERCRP